MAAETGNQIVVYQPNETVRLDMRLENETVWLTQSQMGELFGCTTRNIRLHLENIYGCGDFIREVGYEPSRDLIASVSNRFGNRAIYSFIYGNDSAGRRISIRKGGEAMGPLAGSVVTCAYDANGNVTEYVGMDGTILSHCDYSAFGRAASSMALGYIKEMYDIGRGWIEDILNMIPDSILSVDQKAKIAHELQGGTYDDSVQDFLSNYSGLECALSGGDCAKCCECSNPK